MNKKIISVVLSLALLTVAMVGCGSSTNSSIAEYNGKEIPVGIYISNQLNTLQQILQILPKDGLLDQTLGEETVRQVIQDGGKEFIMSYAAVETEFERLALELDETELTATLAEFDRAWEIEKEQMENLGIGKESMQGVITNNMKADMLFDAYYTEGGERAVSEEEIQAYYNENFTRALIIQLPKHVDGALLEGDALVARQAEIDAVYARAEAGEDLFTILKEQAVLNGQVIPEEVKEADAEAIIAKEGSGFPQELVTELFDTAVMGEVALFSSTEVDVIYQVRDLNSDAGYYDAYKDNMLFQMKYDEFLEGLQKTAEEIGVKINEDAVKEFSPEELLKRM